MKKIYLFLFTIPMLLGACSDSETLQEQSTKKGFSPQISASVDDEPTTKAGVIRDQDYINGEKFSWHEDDKAAVLFNDQRLDYNIAWIDPLKPNIATFFTSGYLPAEGNYDIYGFVPAEGWNLSNYSVTLPEIQKQASDTSAHLGNHMYMRGIKKNEVISALPSRLLDLNYKQLTSVLRIAIKNNSTNVSGPNLQVKSITLSATGNYKFHTKAHLADKDAEGFTADPSGDKSNITLTCYNGRCGAYGADWIFMGYMTLLPGEAFPSGEKAVVSITYTDNTGKHYLQVKEIDPSSFWGQNGIEAGKSYYIQILTGELVEQSYAVRDYYPVPADPKSAMGLVFWTEPGSAGKHGKVLSLNESTELNWAINNESMKEDGASDVDNGLANLSEIFANNISYDNWSAYPLYEWIHKKNHPQTTYWETDTKGVWYLPSIGELQDLYCAYNNQLSERWGYSGSGNDSNDRPSFVPNFLENIPFNAKLLNAGGTAFGQNVFNSSTESDQNTKCSWFINFLDGQVSYVYKHTTKYYMNRAIMTY